MRGWRRSVAVLALLAAASWLAYVLAPARPPSPDGLESARVVRVVDGDTVILDNGEAVRYLGVDTPETVHPDKAIQCFGPEGTIRNRELVEGKRVVLERDSEERDEYGRLLRHVYVHGLYVNGLLVEEGYAFVAAYSNENRKHLSLLIDLEREAREARRGLWGSCGTP